MSEPSTMLDAATYVAEAKVALLSATSLSLIE